MRFSTLATLCAAPLALASSLQADLVARGALLAERTAEKAEEKASSEKSSNNQKSNNNGGNVIIQQGASTSITEVIIIWVNNGGGAATSTVNTAQSVISSTTVAAGAAAVTHEVIVGGTGGLTYTPDNVKAAVGDMVVFTFMSNNHTATQSAFGTPCEALAGGMDSGFMSNVNNTIVPPPQMAMQVTVATPIWFYCKQNGHCGKGMTFSINPDSGNGTKTQAAFKALAIAQNGTGTTAVIAGGAAAASSAAAVAVSSAASAAPAVSTSSSGTMVAGTGTLNSQGACACSCLCGVAAFPNAAVQGVGAFGGISGSMPMSALEVIVKTS